MDVTRLQQRLADAGFYKKTVDGQIGRFTYAALLSYMARRDLGTQGEEIGRGCAAFFPAAELNTGLRIAHFLAQTATETGAYRTLEENLNYSAKRLTEVFKSRFPTIASTAGFANNPEALANKVYGGRLGNGPPASGEGWKYRGRGLIQLTGKTNYAARAKETGLPLVDQPDIVSAPQTSVQAACLFWTAVKLNVPADADDVVAVRQLVNGGQHGIEDCKIHLARAKKVLL